jgi:predicted methyltransferase
MRGRADRMNGMNRMADEASRAAPAYEGDRHLKRWKSFVVWTLAACAASLALPARAQSPHTHHHSFDDPHKWSQVFDDPKRDAWQKPHEVIQALGLAPDFVVADIGAGTGYFTVRLAHNVPKGRVFAVDTEPAMVKHLAERAKRDGLTNITAVVASADDPKLPEKADLVLLVDVYHHIGARERYFRKVADSLKPGGRVAIIDFRMDSPHGPPKSARIAPDRVKAELKKAGYALVQEHAFLPNQYFLVFRRN